ncbi:hypothetical protein V8C86DRAFT_2677320 [Haematococcus lacustris]
MARLLLRLRLPPPPSPMTRAIARQAEGRGRRGRPAPVPVPGGGAGAAPPESQRWRPVLVLLDEVTASVDPHSAAHLHKVLAEALQGVAVLQVAHQLAAVMGCDRVLVMAAGKVVESGAPEQLAATPSLFSALQDAARQL